MDKTKEAVSWERNHSGIVCNYYDANDGCFKWTLFVFYPKREILWKARQDGIIIPKKVEKQLYKL